MAYPTVFMLRRLIFAMTIVLLWKQNFFQIQIVVFKTSMVMAFTGQVRPFRFPEQNKAEVFNEVMCLISTYGLIIFTDFVSDPLARYKCGWALISITLSILAVNCFILFKETIVNFCHVGKIK